MGICCKLSVQQRKIFGNYKSVDNHSVQVDYAFIMLWCLKREWGDLANSFGDLVEIYTIPMYNTEICFQWQGNPKLGYWGAIWTKIRRNLFSNRVIAMCWNLLKKELVLFFNVKVIKGCRDKVWTSVNDFHTYFECWSRPKEMIDSANSCFCVSKTISRIWKYPWQLKMDTIAELKIIQAKDIWIDSSQRTNHSKQMCWNWMVNITEPLFFWWLLLEEQFCAVAKLTMSP